MRHDHSTRSPAVWNALWRGLFWMLVLGGALTLMFLSGGCTSLRSQVPVTKEAHLAVTREVAYAQALRAMVRMGGQVTTMVPPQGVLSFTVHGAAAMHVQVAPEAQGAVVAVTGTLLPGKLALGAFDEVDTYLALLR